MASISRESNGRRTIQFLGSDGKRRSIRLGKMPQRTAEAVKVKVEHLVAAAISGHAVDDETGRWLSQIDHTLADKLANVGLIARKTHVTLGAFIDQYVEGRHDAKPRTVELYRQAQRNLVDYFGADKPLHAITAGEADSWRLYLVKLGLAENTIRRRCGRAKQFMTAAVRRGLIAKSPFADLKSAVQANAARFHFVTRQVAQKILDACPDSQWRVIFALSRFGGLRCPSEVLALRWSNVDWENERVTIPSPKTAHHVGGESRIIPLFPELRTYLKEALDDAPADAEFVVTRSRDDNVNFRTDLNRIIRKAGLKPWPKPFQNLRSSRETELAEEFPMHVVCTWIGNSQPVAAKHYLQITDEHFARAVGRAAKSGAQLVQNPVQQAAAPTRTESQDCLQAVENKGLMQPDAKRCESIQRTQTPRLGLEPRT